MHYDECTMMKCYNALTPAAVKITSSDTQIHARIKTHKEV